MRLNLLKILLCKRKLNIGSTYSLIPPKILSKDEKLSIHILKIMQLITYNFNFLINLWNNG